MQLRRFGSSGRNVVVIGQGTWYIDEADRDSAVAALRTGLDHGLTHLDTAELYGMGVAEEMVGDVISGRRDEVFLVTKVLPENASRIGTVLACERSLTRLRTDRLDCFLLHWRGEHPLEETIAAFQALRDQGKILAWGVSNFDVDDLEETRDIALDDGPVCNQVLYHLQERAIEHEVLPWCEKHNIAVVGYSPFGHGNFPGPNTAGGRVLGRIAEAHGATARQVALRFLVRQAPLFTVPKAANPRHAAENAGALTLRLSEDEIAEIDATFAPGPRPTELPMS